MNRLLAAVLLVTCFDAASLHAGAGELTITPRSVPDLKAVFGQVESRTLSMARARIGGTVTGLKVTEGSAVKAGDELAVVIDDKLSLQLDAVDSRVRGLQSELGNATTELDRATKLLVTGVIAKTRVDALQTKVDVLTNQLTAAQADRAVLVQQAAEGKVLAPASGRVLGVPVTEGSVILPGEPIARIAANGYFIRLSLPERHAAQLHEGDSVEIGERGLQPTAGRAATGKLVKVYPEIQAGRVQADVEVASLGDYFVGERTLVWVPVGSRTVLSVPAAAVTNRSGVDYVSLADEAPVAVVTGERLSDTEIEILSGLNAGDRVIVP